MILTTDDLCPQHIPFFNDHWDDLHERHPDMKLIAFTTANWHGQKKVSGRKFVRFCEKRKDWLILAFHGLEHRIYEGREPKNTQQHTIREMIDIFRKSGLELIPAYKPPFYAFNTDCLEVVAENKIKKIFLPRGILDLETRVFIERDEVGLIDSHVNPKTSMADRIDKVKEEFSRILKNDIQRDVFKF